MVSAVAQKANAGFRINGNGKKIAITVSGVSLSALIACIVWVVSTCQRVQANTKDITDVKAKSTELADQINCIKLETNTIKTLQAERHSEMLRRLDSQDKKLDAIMDKLSK